MGKQLTIDEMLEVASQTGLDSFSTHKQLIESAASYLAEELGRHIGVNTNEAYFGGLAFGGTCAAFFPTSTEQEVPEALKEYDTSAEWN